MNKKASTPFLEWEILFDEILGLQDVEVTDNEGLTRLQKYLQQICLCFWPFADEEPWARQAFKYTTNFTTSDIFISCCQKTKPTTTMSVFCYNYWRFYSSCDLTNYWRMTKNILRRKLHEIFLMLNWNIIYPEVTDLPSIIL